MWQPRESAIAETSLIDKDWTTGSFLDQADFSDECVYDERYEYADDRYSGYYDVWESCGAEGTTFVSLATAPAARRLLPAIQVAAIADADLEALDTILRTFVAD